MLLKALISLRPNNEFTITDNDLSTIVWNEDGVITPSQQEIDAEIARLNAEEATEVAAKEAARNAVVEKLAAVGLTANDVAALLN